nr:MAG TPA: hypothetical protein [Bacteriophage sp.]
MRTIQNYSENLISPFTLKKSLNRFIYINCHTI